jgi:hypothetical protein
MEFSDWAPWSQLSGICHRLLPFREACGPLLTGPIPHGTFHLILRCIDRILVSGHSSMFGLGHLLFPWGIILQIIALVHFVRRRPENYWFFIILFLGPLGAAAYILVEVIPDAKLLRGVFQGFGRRSRIQTLEIQILDNPSPGNYEELGELCLDEKSYSKAREAFTKAITARSDSLHTFYYRAQSALGMNDFAAAIQDLERVVAADHKFDYYRATGLLADAYARTGDLQRAAALFSEVTQFSTTCETLYNYANFLKLQGKAQEARDWTQKLLAKKRTLPGYMQRIERPWFRKGKALQRELGSAT